MFLISACSKQSQLEVVDEKNYNVVQIKLSERNQVIRNFGASDAWACQFVGLWPDEKRNQIADWLFSLENDSQGKPKGIGLSLWRFNIGAGSAAQDNIGDEWRRAEGYLNDDGSYDWSRQSGQRWFMKAAKDRGVNQFVGFTNSPPVQFTKNGRAYSSNGEEANIAPERYLDFSKFLADVAERSKSEGLPFNYLSPFNEPQWTWTGNGQEGSPYKNSEIYAITKTLDSLIQSRGLGVKIQVAEAGKLNYLYEKADKVTRGQQISEFFNNQSAFYVGNFPSVDRIISGHSYFTSAPVSTLQEVRSKVSAAIKGASIPIEFWQSEYCILGGQEEVKPEGKDTGINPALYVARIIHNDLTLANASAWHWWLSVTVYDYKDGLIYADKNKTNGNMEDTKLLWAIGNYSRFVRPGSVRVNTSSSNLNVDNPNGIMISSFLNEIENTITAVIVNYGNSDTFLSVQLEGDTIDSWTPYLTSSKGDDDLRPLESFQADEKILVPKRSVLTLVGQR